MTELDPLNIWEEVYLLSILLLKDNAYGVTIKKMVSKKTGKILSYGGLYFTLSQLVKKGLVAKKSGEPSPKRGGRRKYYYSLTEKGKKNLLASYQYHKSLWEDVSELVFD